MQAIKRIKSSSTINPSYLLSKPTCYLGKELFSLTLQTGPLSKKTYQVTKHNSFFNEKRVIYHYMLIKYIV